MCSGSAEVFEYNFGQGDFCPHRFNCSVGSMDNISALAATISPRMAQLWENRLRTGCAEFLGLETLSPQSTRRKLGLGLHSFFVLVLFYVLFFRFSPSSVSVGCCCQRMRISGSVDIPPNRLGF
jgi:hypothetical protein